LSRARDGVHQEVWLPCWAWSAETAFRVGVAGRNRPTREGGGGHALVAADREASSLPRDEWIGTGGECSERPPNPTLGTGKRLDPDSILNLAERMVGENLAPTRPFATATDFRNRMEARRTLQERFGVCFPAPTALWGLTVRFCVAAGDYKSSWTAATAKPTPTLIRKVFAFLSVGRFGGAQRPPRYASVSSLSPSSGRSMWFSVRCTGSTGITTCYFTRSLETHASLASY